MTRSETHVRWRDKSQFAILTRHFFSRFFDNEFVAPGGEMMFSITQILAVLAVPGAFFAIWAFSKYPFLIARSTSAAAVDSWGDRCFFVSFSMIVMGLVTVVEWDSLFPDRRDYQNLLALPLRVRTFFTAKIASLFLFMTLFSITINSASGVFFPFAATMQKTSFGFLVRFLIGHFVAVNLAGAFVFFFLVALQGFFIAVLPHRLFQKVSVLIQSTLLVLLLSVFLVLGQLIGKVKQSDNIVYDLLFAPAWFTTLYDRILRIPSIHTSLPWTLALAAFGLAFTLSLLFYAIAYRKHVTRLLDANTAATDRFSPASALVSLFRRAFVRHPFELAAFDFVIFTVSRSRKHRMVVGSALGVGIAFSLAWLFGLLAAKGIAGLYQLNLTMLMIPPTLTFMLVGGLRFAFNLPVELRSNWIFRLSDQAEYAQFWRGVRKALILIVVVPLYLAAFLSYGFCWGWPTALGCGLIALIEALLLMEWLFRDFPKIPFACSYLPGKGNLKSRWPVYIVSFSLYVFFSGLLQGSFLGNPTRYSAAVLIGMFLVWRMNRRRERFLKARFVPVYEDLPDPPFLLLGVGSLRLKPEPE
ncbi:MAG: hypothetical protein EHM61_16870 [Acidobacteria bacterium]|nr:MAG: hypothetical protein EHM61_16870 [Acidobacteriota bacterium]